MPAKGYGIYMPCKCVCVCVCAEGFPQKHRAGTPPNPPFAETKGKLKTGSSLKTSKTIILSLGGGPFSNIAFFN